MLNHMFPVRLIAFFLVALLAIPMPTHALMRPYAQAWEDIYNGYGLNTYTHGTWQLKPASALQTNETHASLVKSTLNLQGNYRLTVRMTPLAQLREGSTPNPWETGWITFGHNPDGTFKYLILKPNGYGVELGESLGNNEQNFLYTSPVGTFDFPVGQSYQVVLTVWNGWIIARVNGIVVLRYQMNEKDRLDTNGSFGWYAEDAEVLYGKPSVRQF